MARTPAQIAPVSTPDTEAIMTATTPPTRPFTAETIVAVHRLVVRRRYPETITRHPKTNAG
jgi:hypothetical protein